MLSKMYCFDEKTMEVFTSDDDSKVSGMQSQLWIVDTDPTLSFQSRYGKYDRGRWTHHPISDMPTDFQMYLLLEGIS